MKSFKKFMSVALVASMALSFTGCGKSFKAINKKDFEKGLKAIKLDDDMLEYEDESVSSFLYDDAEYAAMATDDDQMYMFIEFEDEEAAKECFEEEFYEDLEDALEDEEFDGKESHKLKKTSGYIIINGDNEEEGDVYGGIYLKDNIMVVALAHSTKKSDKKDVDAFLKEIGYPKP